MRLPMREVGANLFETRRKGMSNYLQFSKHQDRERLHDFKVRLFLERLGFSSKLSPNLNMGR